MAGSKKPAWMAKSIALTRNTVHVLIALGFPLVMPLPQIRKLGHWQKESKMFRFNVAGKPQLFQGYTYVTF